MTLTELHPVWKEALAICEAFRRLGFTPDDIFLARHTDGRLMIGIRSVNFACVVCLPNYDHVWDFKNATHEELVEGWKEATTCWNTGAEKECREIFDTSFVRANATLLLADLYQANIQLPKTADA